MESAGRISADPSPVGKDATVDDVIETDTLIEEVSIDGMCGVY